MSRPVRQAPKHSAGMTVRAVAKGEPHVLQDFLAAAFRLSRRSAKAMIDGRNVWVNRKCVWIAGYALRTGDEIALPEQVVKGAARQSHSPVAVAAPAAKRHVRVLWENDNYLVADKPAGLVSCDDPLSAEAILRVQCAIPTLEAVHRLDRDTTGCLLFAKRHAAKEAAVEVFKTHRVAKVYHAIAAGRFEYSHLSIDAPLDGLEAHSSVRREAVGEEASFLAVKIETGRTNQIRRHLAAVRHPIVGDKVFGLKKARDPRLMRLTRQMLHASTLELPDPLQPKAVIRAHSPLPADFRAALALFGMGRR